MTIPQFTPALKTPQDTAPDGPLAHLAAKLLAMRTVDPVTGCWLWAGGTDDKGYGRVRAIGQRPRVHRLAAAIWLGLDLSDRKSEACHNCPGGDNPLCFNPSHLFLGTHADNMADRGAKGRTATGARSKCTHLTDGDVAEIRRLREQGWSCRVIGERFGIGGSAVSRIARGVRWPSR